MLYVVVVQGVEHQVEITSRGADQFTVYIDGERLEVNARQIDPRTLSVIRADNRAYTAALDIDSTSQEVVAVEVGHARIDVAVYDLRRQAMRQSQQHIAAADGPAPITTPMPGKVVAVLAKEGQQVQAGQGLVVVEAMKMENELRAPKAGTVRQMRAQIGQAVDNGALLCVVE